MAIALIVGVLQFFIMTLILILIYKKGYQKVPPGQALVVFGKAQDPKGAVSIITKGGLFVLPVVQSHALLPLDVKSFSFTADDVPSKGSSLDENLQIDLKAQYRIPEDGKMLKKAAENILNKSDQQLNELVETVLDKHLRDELFKFDRDIVIEERQMISDMISKASNKELKRYGIELDSSYITKIKMK